MARPALEQLEGDGLLQRERAILRTTRRWQGAMARAALSLYRTGDVGEDLRVPIAAALLALYGPEETSERIAELVETMLPIELAELSPPPAM